MRTYFLSTRNTLEANHGQTGADMTEYTHSSPKDQLRKQGRRARQALAREERHSASRAVVRCLLDWKPFLQRDCVAGYIATDAELDVSEALTTRLQRGGQVWLPRVTATDPPDMEFAPVSTLDELQEGTYGIPEPIQTAGRLASIDLVMVPGVAFDRGGGRIGRGMGYYDRLLRRRLARTDEDAGSAEPRESVFVLGVCYDCQLYDAPLPTDGHDVDMNGIVTEHELIRT